VFTIFIVLLVGFFIFTYLFVPETKNRTFEEIANQFSAGVPRDVEETTDEYDGLDETDPDHKHALNVVAAEQATSPRAQQ